MSASYWGIALPLEHFGSRTEYVKFDKKLDKWVYDYYELGKPYLPAVTALTARISSDGTLFENWRPSNFFGKWNFRSSTTPKSIVIQDETRWAPSNDHFQKRSHEGEIVVSEMNVEKYRIEAIPYYSDGRIRYRDTTNINSQTDDKLLPMTTVKGISQKVHLTSATTGVFFQFSVRTVYWQDRGVKLPTLDPELLLGHIRRFPKEPSEKLAVEVMSRLNDGTMDLLTELAELPATLEMGMDALRLFSNKGAKFRRIMNDLWEDTGDPRRLAKLADKLAQARLTYRYGILPVSYTLEDIKRLLKESFKAQYVKESGSEETDLKEILPIADYQFHGSAVHTQRVWAKRALDPTDNWQQFQKAFGASLPRTVWELGPWTLVVDWFVNVGDTLLALSPMPNIGEGSTISWRTTVQGYYSSPNEPGAMVRVDYNSYQRSLRGMHDNVCATWQPSMTRDRWADAAAFSWQIARKQLTNLKRRL